MHNLILGLYSYLCVPLKKKNYFPLSYNFYLSVSSLSFCLNKRASMTPTTLLVHRMRLIYLLLACCDRWNSPRVKSA